MAIRLVVFDLDGTLIDSFAGIRQAMEVAALENGVAPPRPEAVRGVIGLPLREAISAVFPTLTEDHWDRLTTGYKQAFTELAASEQGGGALFAGATDCLEALNSAGFLLGIATGKGRRGLDAALDRHGLTHHFVTLQTSDFGPGKPHPYLLNRAMAEAGVFSNNTIMIGDTTYDMEMAKAAGTRAIGVAWGYHATSGLLQCGADHIAKAFDDVVPTVMNLFNDLSSEN